MIPHIVTQGKLGSVGQLNGGEPSPESPAGIPTANLRAGLAWYAMAHTALIAAAFRIAVDPEILLGAWQRPAVAAVVHLVTLGWIAGSVFGSLLLLGQGVLRLGFLAGRRELIAAPVWALGLAFFISRLAIVDPLGQAVAASLFALALGAVAVRVVSRVPRSTLPFGMRFALSLSWINLLLAVAGGLLICAGRLGLPIPGTWVDWRLAHLHLAAVGWVTTLVVGAGARMVPMLLPAAAPRNGAVAAIAALFGFGAPVLAATLLFAPHWAPIAAIPLLAGAFGWVGLVGWMLAHPRRPPQELPQPDPARWLALAATSFLAAAAICGAVLAFTAPLNPSHWAVAYALFGLVGFHGAMILAVELRLLPTVAWLLARRHLGFEVPFPSAHRLPPRRLSLATAAAMALSVPLLALGTFAEAKGMIRAGAVLLAAAPVLHLGVVGTMLRKGRAHLWPRSSGSKADDRS